MPDRYPADRKFALLLASAVRNALEEFHGKHLSDVQMAELNPLVRNALFPALVAMRRSLQGDAGATAYLDFLRECIPSYWEPPGRRHSATRPRTCRPATSPAPSQTRNKITRKSSPPQGRGLPCVA